MKNNINVIFDFDGTLVDSFCAVIKKFNLLAEEFNFRYIHENEINDLRHFTSKELIKHLKIPIYKLPRVILKARALMRDEIKKLPSFVEMFEIIQKLYESNVNLGILTSNSSENVTEWLKLQNMYHFFKFIHIESNYFGKKRILKKILKSYKMDPTQTFYIGDETRDIEAAKGCGVYAIAVTWGFNSEQILLQHHAHFIARKPEDIITSCHHEVVFNSNLHS